MSSKITGFGYRSKTRPVNKGTVKAQSVWSNELLLPFIICLMLLQGALTVAVVYVINQPSQEVSNG